MAFGQTTRILILGLWMLFPGPTQSAESYTAAQIDAMTDTQRKGLSFLATVRAVDPKRFSGLRFIMQRSLAELGYGNFGLQDATDEQIRVAVSEYQRRVGDRITGDLTVAQQERITKAVQTFNARTINLGPKIFNGVEGYYVAEGTWTMRPDGHAFPQNLARIQCSKERGSCVEAFSYISDGFGMLTLSSFINEYIVTRWTTDEIQAEIAHLCVVNTIFFNIKSKSVTMMRRSKPGSTCGPEFYLESKILELSNGIEVGGEAQRKKFQTEVIDVMNPALWARYMSLSQ